MTSKQTIIIGIDDAKIFELTADSDSSGDNVLTYATAIEVPNIQKMELTDVVTEKPLSKDEQVFDYSVKRDYIAWAFQSAKISLDALAILEGGAVTTTGVTPNQVNTYSITESSIPKYFKLEAKANYSAGEVGDFHLKLYKCKANNIDIQYVANDYAIVSVTGVAIPTKHDGRIKDYVINETPSEII